MTSVCYSNMSSSPTGCCAVHYTGVGWMFTMCYRAALVHWARKGLAAASLARGKDSRYTAPSSVGNRDLVPNDRLVSVQFKTFICAPWEIKLQHNLHLDYYFFVLSISSSRVKTSLIGDHWHRRRRQSSLPKNVFTTSEWEKCEGS